LTEEVERDLNGRKENIYKTGQVLIEGSK